MSSSESGPPAADAPGAAAGSLASRLVAHRLAVAVVVATALPILWHGVRAALGDWVPSGDDAYFTLRSLDVATGHHPLLGAWSSGSVDVGRQVNNLGSMQLVLLAPFTKVAWAGGTAIGVVAVHLAAVVAMAWLAHRIGGQRQVLATMCGVAVMATALGSEMLVTPRQHQFLLLTYLCVLVAAHAGAVGDRWAPLVFVVFASLAVQTHLSYPILVVMMAVPLVVGQVLAWRADRDRRRIRAWWIAVGTGVLLWVQSLLDLVFGSGNAADVLRSSGTGVAPGLTTGARIVADVVIGLDGVLRPGFARFDPTKELGGDVQVLLLGVLTVGLAAEAVRRRSRWAATACVALVAAVIDASRLPVTFFGLAAANYRWLWPTTAFLLIGLLGRLLHRAGPTTGGAVARLLDVGPAALVVAVIGAASLVNVPRSYQVDRPEQYVSGQTATATITGQLLDELPRRSIEGPVVVDQSELYFGHPFAYPVGVVLAELGLGYRFEGDGQARRFGADRVADGTEPYRLVLRHGPAAAERFGAPDTVAYAAGPSPVSVTLERVVAP